MTGQEFESFLCEIFKSRGYWALNIPKNKSGAQPFDVIALKGAATYAVDCKVCQVKSFPLRRVEDNQWLAFETLLKASPYVNCGLMVYRDENIYFLPYECLKSWRSAGKKSVKLDDWFIWSSAGQREFESLMRRKENGSDCGRKNPD